MLTPGGSLVIGALAGILSVCGFQYIQVVILSTIIRMILIIHQPMLLSKLKIHDTCGVNNLHGMPGMKKNITDKEKNRGSIFFSILSNIKDK